MQVQENINGSGELKSANRMAQALFVVLLFSALLFGAKDAAFYTRNALSVCVSSVIPNVFPLMVVSGILVSGDGGELISYIFGGAVSRMFAISRTAAPAVILGFICGFPIGAATASKLYEKGSISKKEFSYLLTFVNNPSAAFVIYTVGGGMLGSVKLGMMIYFSVIISAIITGVINRYVMGINRPLPSRKQDIHHSLSEVTVSSVASAIRGTLNVCAYAAFFSASVGVVSEILARFRTSFQLRAALFGFFELIGGVNILSQSGSHFFAVLSSAAVCSWSGLSVLMQIMAVCRFSLKEDKISFVPMILSKCFQATLCPILVFLLIKLTHFDI